MRNKKHIKTILKNIEKIWIKNPNLRLCQLIQNCFENADIYYVTDEKLSQLLKKYYEVSDWGWWD